MTNLSNRLVTLAAALALQTAVSLAQPSQFTVHPPQKLTPELRVILGEGEYNPALGLEKIKALLAATSDTGLRASLLHQAAEFAGMANLKTEERTYLGQLIANYPNSDIEVNARYRMIDLDFHWDDYRGKLEARSQLVQRFGGPSVEQLSQRSPQAISQLRNLDAKLLEAMGYIYGKFTYLYLDLKDRDRALAFAQLNREMELGTETPREILQIYTGKSWYGQTTQNPVVRVIKPTSHRSGSRPRLVVEISDGDYREPQLNWEKFAIRLDSQDLKKVASYKSQFDTKLREGHIFERLRVIYRPESALAPGPHTLVIYAPVYGYRGTGLGATRVEYRFVVPPPEQRGPGDKDDEQPEPDDRDFR